ncbi:MAG: alpha/beta fold hydrolase [Candidatus Binatia bacterium]
MSLQSTRASLSPSTGPANTTLRELQAPAPPAARARFAQLDGMFPFADRFVTLDGCQVHYVDEGTGPPLLMLHGNPTWSFLYRHLIRELSSRFRCIALDYPGFGLSTARPDYDFLPASHASIVAGFIRTLDLHDAFLMVQDWGGPIGFHAAGSMPERFRGLVVCNTWAWPVDDDPHFSRFSQLMGGWFGGFVIRRFNAFVNLLIPAGVKRRRIEHNVMDCYRAPFPTPASRVPTHVFPREILGSLFLSDAGQRLQKLAHLPALILWGDLDFAFRAQERERLERLLPNYETVILHGAGHFVQEDAPQEIADNVAALLVRLGKRR